MYHTGTIFTVTYSFFMLCILSQHLWNTILRRWLAVCARRGDGILAALLILLNQGCIWHRTRQSALMKKQTVLLWHITFCIDNPQEYTQDCSMTNSESEDRGSLNKHPVLETGFTTKMNNNPWRLKTMVTKRKGDDCTQGVCRAC